MGKSQEKNLGSPSQSKKMFSGGNRTHVHAFAYPNHWTTQAFWLMVGFEPTFRTYPSRILTAGRPRTMI